MIGIIVAMNADRVIGVNGSIPWRYSADLVRFKRVTMGCTVVMGRKTWESIPAKSRPLAGRFNVVVTSATPGSLLGPDGTADTVCAAIDLSRLNGDVRPTGDGGVVREKRDVWFIGGARIYAGAMQYADVIDVTWVPWRACVFCGASPVAYAGAVFCGAACCAQAEAHEIGASVDVALFPPIDETVFAPGPREPHPDDPALVLQRFERRFGLKDNEKLHQAGTIRR